MSDLIKALQIFAKYSDVKYPTCCVHDAMLVMVEPSVVSDADKSELDSLGFFVGTEYPDCFTSFRYGSA